MRQYTGLYGEFLCMHFKGLLEYRADFIIGLVAVVFIQGASLATIGVVMQQVPSLNGWTLPEVMLIYGLVIFSRSCSMMFTEYIWALEAYIREGEFDRYLVRPINPLFHVLASGFNLGGVGTFLVGGTVVVLSGQTLGIFSSALNIAYLVVAVASGAVIFFAINLITCTSSFWIINSAPISSSVFETYLFAHYPLNIFPRAIQFLLTWIIPYGFTSYYPASFLLGRDVGPLVWISPLIAVALLVLGYRFWLVGLGRYEGTGS